MSAVVQFISPAEQALETEERLGDLVDCLVELGQRLDNLEAMAVEAAGADPLGAIIARLDTFENRLARIELRQRRPVPLTVIQNCRLDPDQQQMFNELQRLFNRLDRDLAQRVTAFNGRLDRCATQFHQMRKRVAAIEAKQGATP